jgi:hypothetical protein
MDALEHTVEEPFSSPIVTPVVVSAWIEWFDDFP